MMKVMANLVIGKNCLPGLWIAAFLLCLYITSPLCEYGELEQNL